MKIRDHIQRVQSLYNHGIVIQTKGLPDRYAYNKLLTVRSKLINQQISKKQKISDFNYSTLNCVELIEVSASQCPCLPNKNCTVYRTKYALPKPLTNSYNNQAIESVFSIDDNIKFNESSKTEYLYQAHAKYTSSKPIYIIENGFLFFYGINIPRVVNVKLLLADPIAAYTFSSLCSTAGLLNDNCMNIQDIEFPIDSGLEEDMIEIAKNELIREFLSIEKDSSNDSNDDIQAVKTTTVAK